MKAKVIETGEIIDVKCLRPVIYSRLSGGKIIEEYNEDELEFLNESNKPKMISLDKACEWLYNALYTRANGALHYVASKEKITHTEFVAKFRKAMEE